MRLRGKVQHRVHALALQHVLRHGSTAAGGLGWSWGLSGMAMRQAVGWGRVWYHAWLRCGRKLVGSRHGHQYCAAAESERALGPPTQTLCTAPAPPTCTRSAARTSPFTSLRRRPAAA